MRPPTIQIIARRVSAAAQAMGLVEGTYSLRVDPDGAITITPLTIDTAQELSAANEDWIQEVGDGGRRQGKKRGKAHAP